MRIPKKECYICHRSARVIPEYDEVKDYQVTDLVGRKYTALVCRPCRMGYDMQRSEITDTQKVMLDLSLANLVIAMNGRN